MRLWPRRRVYVDDLPRTHDLRFGGLFVLAFLVLIAGLYVLGYLAAGNRLPVGTKIAGIDVGGMKQGEASTTLQDVLAPRLERRITVTVLDHTFSVYPQRAGMTFDLEATISAGLDGSSWDPRHMLHVLAGGESLKPVVDVDKHELNATLRHIAAVVDRRPVDAVVSFQSGAPELTYAQEGRALDFARSGQRLEAALIAGDDKVSLPLDNVDPAVSSGAGSRFLRTVASTAVSSPVSIRVAGTHVVLRPRTFVSSLRSETRDGRLRLSVEPTRLLDRSQSLIRALPYHPVNAAIAFRDGRPRVDPSRSGVSIAAPAWARAVLKAVGRTGAARHAPVHFSPDPPPFTTADARMLRLRKPVAAVAVPLARRDVTGGQQAADQLDGALVEPRATFSFLGRVSSGDTAAQSLVASAVYRAALTAGMSDVQRTPDPGRLRGVADGMDALVQPASSDLSWQNSTPYGVYVHSWVTRATVHVQLWSSPYWAVRLATSGRYDVTRPQVQRDMTPGCVPRRGAAGFAVDVTRTSAHRGQPRRVETYHSSYPARDAVVCRRRGGT